MVRLRDFSLFKTMRQAAMGAVVLSGAFLSADALAAARNSDEVQVLPAAFKEGLVYLRVSLEGGASVWMLLDTGDEGCSLDVSEARRRGLRLTSDPAGVGGFGERRQEAFKTKVALQIGTLSLRRVACRAYTLAPVQGPDGQPVAGVLGYALLAGKVLTIDYPNQRVQLDSGPRQGGIAVDLVAHLPVVDIKIGTRSARALIDTGGAYGLLIAPAAAESLGLSEQLGQAQAIEGVGASGRQAVKLGTAPSFSVAGVEQSNPPVVYASFGTETVSFDAALGRDVLSRYKLVLDYRARTFRLDR